MKTAKMAEELVFNLDEIPRSGRTIEIPLERDWSVSCLPVAWTIPASGGGIFSGALRLVEDKLLVNGRLSVVCAFDCSRCAETRQRPLDVPLNLLFVPEGEKSTKLTGDEELVDDDAFDDIETYTDRRVDLLPYLGQALALELEPYPLCSEDCKGLCASCGTDLNQGACRCEEPIDERWAALKKLKIAVDDR